MRNRNLLLGFGETLTYPIEHKPMGGDKAHPYSFEEAQLYLLNNTQKLIEKINTLPPETMPNGKIVANFVLHPAYLAKSYYPAKFFKEFGFNDLGSKSVYIVPRKTQLKKAPEQQVTSNIFISGNQHSFNNLLDVLKSISIEEGLQKEIIKNEDLYFFDSKDKIKGIFQKGVEKQFEIVLHTPENEKNILEAFYHFSNQIGVDIQFDKRISTPGLTFLPMNATSEHAQLLSAFTYLRVLREMPKLRIFEPLIQRSIHVMPSMLLPKEQVQDPNINVAVFDGGIGNTNLSMWCTEITDNGSTITHQNLLNHGSEVTSTILFGNIKDNQTSLPVPYSKIDHYRVLDSSTPDDPDLFLVLKKILHALETKDYHFVNLSLGPRIPIEDDDIHVWTSTIDDYLAHHNTLLTVAVGNDGNIIGQNRIQPPSDMVNALAVGAATTEDMTWEKTNYSCIGPGRSPGLIKPDGLAFGGDHNNPFLVYSPITGEVHSTAGTSFSSPLVLRNCIGLACMLDTAVNPLAIKALMIHNIESKSLPQEEIGRGRFPNNINEIIFNADNEVSIVYQGKLFASEYVRVPIPFTDEDIKGNVSIKATFCFTAKINSAHPDNYTNNGLTITFRPNKEQPETKTFFSQKDMFETESEARRDAHKWETVLHHEKAFRASSLKNPCFDIVYQARDAGKAIKKTDAESLPYVLVVTVKVKEGYQLYNNIRQKYQTLQPIRVKQEIQIRT